MFDITLLIFLESLMISLGAGVSTFAVLSYFASIQDGVIEKSERRIMGSIYFVLRLAMFSLSIILILLLFLTDFSDYSVWFRALIMLVIISNAVLMTAHRIPMWFGPPLMFASWYTYLFYVVFSRIYYVPITSSDDFVSVLGMYLIVISLSGFLYNSFYKPVTTQTQINK
ncbi:MAG: hypothetical protein OXU73_00535 [Candidatus Campbellbacteria bacterium]|nr:hypothetical protein [Candidatus Campbellbacteria bacterium]